MADLPALLASLNDCKIALSVCLVNRSTSCCCEQRCALLSGISSLTNVTLTQQQIEDVLAMSLAECPYCTTLKSLQQQFEDLKSQVYDKISVDYSLTVNPFIV
jgi:hypothetical protein